MLLCRYVCIRFRGTHRIDSRLEGGMGVGGRFRDRRGGGSIDLVSVFQELLPRDYGSLSGSELHREHLPVARFDEGRRSPRRFPTTNTNSLLFLHKDKTNGCGPRILRRLDRNFENWDGTGYKGQRAWALERPKGTEGKGIGFVRERERLRGIQKWLTGWILT